MVPGSESGTGTGTAGGPDWTALHCTALEVVTLSGLAFFLHFNSLPVRSALSLFLSLSLSLSSLSTPHTYPQPTSSASFLLSSPSSSLISLLSLSPYLTPHLSPHPHPHSKSSLATLLLLLLLLLLLTSSPICSSYAASL